MRPVRNVFQKLSRTEQRREGVVAYLWYGPILGIYINGSQTHECGNWDWSRAITRKGIHKWDFRCSEELAAEKLQCTGKSFNTWERDSLWDYPHREEMTGHTSKGIIATVETEESTHLVYYTSRNIYKCEETMHSKKSYRWEKQCGNTLLQVWTPEGQNKYSSSRVILYTVRNTVSMMWAKRERETLLEIFTSRRAV